MSVASPTPSERLAIVCVHVSTGSGVNRALVTLSFGIAESAASRKLDRGERLVLLAGK